MLGPAVEPGAALPRFLIDVPAELGGDHHLVAERRHRFAQQPLDMMGPVSLGGIEQGHAVVARGMDDPDHLGAGGDGGLIGPGHVLDTEPDAGHFQRAEPAATGAGRGGAFAGCSLGGGRGRQRGQRQPQGKKPAALGAGRLIVVRHAGTPVRQPRQDVVELAALSYPVIGRSATGIPG
jgi:hypothetical protein